MLKGVILAGGSGTRLEPATKVTNKHLLCVWDKPMIYYPLYKLLDAGIKDILIITGPDNAGDFIKLLGSGKSFNAHFTYRIQDDAGGIAQAVGMAEDFVGDSKFVVILGDNYFEDDIAEYAQKFEEWDIGCMLFFKECDDDEKLRQSGVAVIRDGKIIEMIEKPEHPPSNLITTGLYFYDPKAFRTIDISEPSARGELEIEDVNNWYIKNNEVSFVTLEGFWSDMGTSESLFRTIKFIREGK